MDFILIGGLEEQIKKTFKQTGDKLNKKVEEINDKKQQLNAETEVLLVDINGLIDNLSDKYIKIKNLEKNIKKDKLDNLITDLKYKKKSHHKSNNTKISNDKGDTEEIEEAKNIKNNKKILNKVNNANDNNKQIEQLNILTDKISLLSDDATLDKNLLLKVIEDMKNIMNLVPENINNDDIKDKTLNEMKGGKYDVQYNNVDKKLNTFSDKYYKLLNNKSKLKTYVNGICNKYNNTTDCINIIFETLETINLTDLQIKSLDFDLNEIKNNNVNLLKKKQQELDNITKINRQNEELLSKINNKLQNNLNKYKQSYSKYIDIDNAVSKIYSDSTTDNKNIEKVILEYDTVNSGLLNKLDELTKENIDLEMSKSNIKNDMNDNNETIISLQTEVADLKNQLYIIQEANKKRINEFMQKLNSSNNEKQILTDNISKLEDKLKNVENQKQIMETKISNANNETLNQKILSYENKIKKYKNMLDDANKWKIHINSQLLEIKNNLQSKIKNFDEVEILLNDIKDFNVSSNIIKNKELQFKIKDLSSKLNYLSNIKTNNEQKLLEIDKLISNDDLTIQEIREKLKEYRNSIVENLQ